MTGQGRWAGYVGLFLITAGGVNAQEPAESHRYEFRQTHMGSEFKILLYTTTEADASRASARAFARIAALDLALSDYNPESELMRLCDRSGGPAVAISEDLFRCLEQGQRMAEESDGAFDVTVGPVVRLWRRARRTRKLPDPETLAKARELVGYRNLVLDREHRTAQLLKTGMKLDLGGLAKGFAGDEAIAALRAAGVRSALVAGAGDIVVSDAPPALKGWTVAVADPDRTEPDASRTLLLSNAAISTAGDAEQYVEIDGKRYAHIVDPRTGIGLVSRASVTVVARDGLTSDSLDTTAYILGADKGLQLVERFQEAAALYVEIGNGRRVFTSKRWEPQFQSGL